MAAGTQSALQKATLIITAVSLVGWGVPLLLVPQFLFVDIGGAAEAVPAVYSRYSGAWFLGAALAAIIALRTPARTGAIFELLAVAAGLSAIALAGDYFAGNSPLADWFIWLGIVDGLVICVLSVLSRPKA